MQIEDGTGSGFKASVSSENRILSDCVTQTLEHHVNAQEKQAYNMIFQIAPSVLNAPFLYIQNTSPVDMILEGIAVQWSDEGYIEIKLGDTGTYVADTEITPANLNAGSANPAVGIFVIGDDLTNGGAATLGGGKVVDRIYYDGSAATQTYNFEQDIIVPQNLIYTMWSNATSGSAAGSSINGTVVFHYHAKE